MTLKNALDNFEAMLADTSKKSEIKVYQEFIQILRSLQESNLSETEIQAIETELDALDWNSNATNRKKHLKKALSQFKEYLKDTFSLTPPGYYTNMGIGLGSAFGILFGIVVLARFERSLGIALGIGIGMSIGMVIGRTLDSQAKASGKMIS
jgi:hypothetical protein